MTDMPHNPAFAANGMPMPRLRAAVQRMIAQLSQPGRDAPRPDGPVQAERHLAAARRREEARRATDRLLR
jgi:hypothetical protein